MLGMGLFSAKRCFTAHSQGSAPALSSMVLRQEKRGREDWHLSSPMLKRVGVSPRWTFPPSHYHTLLLCPQLLLVLKLLKMHL